MVMLTVHRKYWKICEVVHTSSSSSLFLLKNQNGIEVTWVLSYASSRGRYFLHFRRLVGLHKFNLDVFPGQAGLQNEEHFFCISDYQRSLGNGSVITK